MHKHFLMNENSIMQKYIINFVNQLTANMNIKLPSNTVSRLSQYRRVLQKYKDLEKHFIYSHDLANLLHIKPVQVRRDMMLLGISGNFRNGYDVNDILGAINTTLPLPQTQKATIIGMGHIGRALLYHISSNPDCPTRIPCTFDINPKIINRPIREIPCYDISKAIDIIQKNNIKIAIITLISDDIQFVVDTIINAGIKSIVNFTGGPLRTSAEVYFKEFDIRTTLEEISYFMTDDLKPSP